MDRYIGYACLDGTLGEQIAALKTAGARKILTNVGSRESWSQWQATLARLCPGDILVVWKLEVLGFSVPRLIHFMSFLDLQGIRIKSLSEDWLNTAGPHGAVIRQVFSTLQDLAQKDERLPFSDAHTAQQQERAKRNAPGRPPIMNQRQVAEALWRHERGASITQIAAAMGVGRMTVARALAKAKLAFEGNSRTVRLESSTADQVLISLFDQSTQVTTKE